MEEAISRWVEQGKLYMGTLSTFCYEPKTALKKSKFFKGSRTGFESSQIPSIHGNLADHRDGIAYLWRHLQHK